MISLAARVMLRHARAAAKQWKKINSCCYSEMSNKDPFTFTDYDCIGFDLDNTIARYKVGAMVELEYKALSDYLINEKNYSLKHLNRPIQQNVDFMIKGLILDVRNGNIIRINPDGYVIQGAHGTSMLSNTALVEYYGENRHWEMTDMFAQDPLSTWNGPPADNMRSCMDYFDMPASLIFARTVDSLDEEHNGRLPSYNIWPDILDALNHVFFREHFAANMGGYFPDIKLNPEQYLYKCSDNVKRWIAALQARNKVLFVITGSNTDFAAHTASHVLGPEWQSMFDITICFAKKPGFFTQSRPFLGLNGFEETGPVPSNNIRRGGIYSMGNWKELYHLLKGWSRKENPKVVYIGDNLVQDVYTPSVHTQCDAVAISEELQAEPVFGFEQVSLFHLAIFLS